VKIRVRVSNSIPTKHNYRVLQPSIEIEDDVMPGENPMQAFRRISIMANAMFAREVLDQLRFTDRMHQESNEAWCDELLSTVAADHPAMKGHVNPASLPPELQAALKAIGDAIGSAAADACKKVISPTI
jgi:hypothetical protein